MDKLTIEPIAYIHTEFKEKFGIPRQSGRVMDVTGKIVFEKKYRSIDALKGIEGFNYLWILFDFSMSHIEEFNPTVRPPRLGGNERMGVFATRSPYRPNSIGLSSVKLEGVFHSADEGDYLLVSGVDLLDGTPIIDIKPYIPSTDCHLDATGSFSDEHNNDHLEVEFIKYFDIDTKTKNIIKDLISQDPRPGYQNDDRIYSMRYSNLDVHFKVINNKATVVGIDKIK